MQCLSSYHISSTLAINMFVELVPIRMIVTDAQGYVKFIPQFDQFKVINLGQSLIMYYCGWNGCGQVEGYPRIISTPSYLSYDGPIMTVSCSWSMLAVSTDKSLTFTGFIENQLKASKQISLSDGSRALNVSSSLSHTLIASSNGKCFSYNPETNAVRQLVNFWGTEPSNNEDGECENEDSIIKVSCSDYSNLAVSKSGKVFTIPSVLSTPGLMVTDVCCGNEHCVLLTKSGSVYTWGSSSRGQLGHCDLEPEEGPRLVDALAGIQVLQISSGAWHTAAVTSSGDLYTWGWGSDGQLGIEDEEDKQDTYSVAKEINIRSSYKDLKYRGLVQTFPIPVDIQLDVKSASCGSRHTVVLLDDGTVWGCGWNSYGQLGHPPEKYARSPFFILIPIPNFEGKISKIQCGGWSSCFIV